MVWTPPPPVGDAATIEIRRKHTMQITRIGLDLAKNVFEVHGVDAQDNAVF